MDMEPVRAGGRNQIRHADAPPFMRLYMLASKMASSMTAHKFVPQFQLSRDIIERKLVIPIQKNTIENTFILAIRLIKLAVKIVHFYWRLT